MLAKNTFEAPPNEESVGNVWSPVLVPDRLEADTAPKKVAAPAAVIKAFPPPLPTWKAPSVLSTPVPQYIPLEKSLSSFILSHASEYLIISFPSPSMNSPLKY